MAQTNQLTQLLNEFRDIILQLPISTSCLEIHKSLVTHAITKDDLLSFSDIPIEEKDDTLRDFLSSVHWHFSNQPLFDATKYQLIRDIIYDLITGHNFVQINGGDYTVMNKFATSKLADDEKDIYSLAEKIKLNKNLIQKLPIFSNTSLFFSDSVLTQCGPTPFKSMLHTTLHEIASQPEAFTDSNTAAIQNCMFGLLLANDIPSVHILAKIYGDFGKNENFLARRAILEKKESILLNLLEIGVPPAITLQKNLKPFLIGQTIYLYEFAKNTVNLSDNLMTHLQAQMERCKLLDIMPANQHHKTLVAL